MAANQTAKPKELEIIPPSTAKSIENFCEGGWEAICMVKHLQSYMHLVSATLTSYTSAEVLARNMLHIEAHPDNYSFEIPTHARLWQAQMQTHLRTLKEIYHAIQPTRIAPRKLPTSSTCRTVASYRSLVDAADDLDRITGTGGILETAMEKGLRICLNDSEADADAVIVPSLEELNKLRVEGRRLLALCHGDAGKGVVGWKTAHTDVQAVLESPKDAPPPY
ncbi:hypothetical protein LTR09_001268 [Extremus antarcticus]|uniref:Uncharacterized protein n=1 Tax=Extremus antarcticus TaxID=702011 RepID=A0AAJ0LWK5_9PEZI|nr:hypothetical protein LTR09_001268 [Extremus antarcticus]